MIKSKICKMLLLTDDWALVNNKISCKPKSSVGQASILKWMNRFQNTLLHETPLKHALPCENNCYCFSLQSIQTPQKKQAHP